MAMHESFYTSIIFIILYNFTFINHGVSQINYDYAANVRLLEVSGVPNKYFKIIKDRPPEASFSITSKIEDTTRIYFVDYSTDRSGRTETLSSILLCNQIEQNNTSPYLRDQIFFNFLFLRQRICPIKPETIKIPNSMEMDFDYGYIISSNITCKPWKYKQQLRFNSRPYLSITYGIYMAKKYKCDPQAESVWAKKLAEAKTQEKSDEGNT